MAFSDVKIHYYQSMLRIHSRRLPVFAAMIPIACVLSSGGVAQVVSSQTQNQAQDQVQAHFIAAQQDQQQGHLDDAVREYQAVLHRQPGIPEVYANLGLVYYAKGDFEDSARALASAAKLRPGMRGVSLWLGIDEVRLNHPVQGVTLLREAIRLDPKEKLAQSWLGTALWDAGQMDAALIQLRKAAEQFPDAPDLLFALGEAYGKAAKQGSEKLLEDSAGTAISDRIYASAYAAERDWTKAEGHLRRAIVRDPHSVDAELELAEVFLQETNLPAAQLQLDAAAALAPNSAAVLARGGELLVLAGQQAEGLSRIDQALQKDRDETLDALGLPVNDRINGNNASAELLAMCRKAAENLEAMQTPTLAAEVALAALDARSGDFDAAERAYRQLAPTPEISRPTANALAQAKDALHAHHYDT
ncbi:MAG: tetratricopeptide repeat protein, partial [Thiobacillaceae bacterium]